MLSQSEYLADPCGRSSIPYWKAKIVRIPDNMWVLHQRDMGQALPGWKTDAVYFRLRHDLRDIGTSALPGYRMVTAGESDAEDIVKIINCSYLDCRISRETVLGYAQTPVYAPGLWVFAEDERNGERAACGLAALDRETGEMSLEWIQVLPGYRRRGIGGALVNELLRRGAAAARFATVSGKAGSRSNPERLYRRCGFTGWDYWYILNDEGGAFDAQ